MKKSVALPAVTTPLANREAALRLLQAVGYEYLPPAQVWELRAGRPDEVLLLPVLAAALRRLNPHWQAPDNTSPETSKAGVRDAIEALRHHPPAQDFGVASHYLYELLTQGRYYAVTGPGGEQRVHAVRYLDWETPSNNTWHVTEEFTVARMGHAGSYTPDIVLHVNGIPLVIIDCQATSSSRATPAGVARHLRFQEAGGIPSLYVFAQLLLTVSGSGPARYATTATPAEGWVRWRERRTDTPALDERLAQLQHVRAEATFHEAYYAALRPHPAHAGRYAPARNLLALAADPTPQDELLFQLGEPARLLEIVRDYVLSEPERRVVARYYQYYAVRRTLAALLAGQPGGVLWHTQGSGKTLTLVLLARLLTRHSAFPGAQVVVVSDRADLDQQLTHQLRQAGLAVAQAGTGAGLVELLSEAHPPAIITTLIQKFAAVVKTLRPVDRGNLFVLVDEGHRTQYGQLGAQMHQVFPQARFIAFTGTPLQRAERSTAELFGGYLHRYTVGEAVRDGTVLPLLYEDRRAGQRTGLVATDEPDAADGESLTWIQAEWQARASDIATHFHRTWRGTGFKGQVLVPTQLAAVRLKELLDATGLVKSEVLLTSSREYRGHLRGKHGISADEVQAFWATITARLGWPAQYEQQVRSQWLDPASELDLLITVDRLLTGFDNPYNAVLYLCRRLHGHHLFQALARVNRPAPGKAHGFVLDYEGNLAELQVALASFATEDFADYETAALRGAAEPGVSLLDAAGQLAHLDAVRNSLHTLFRGRVSQPRDSAAYLQVLADGGLRREFLVHLPRLAQLVQLERSARLGESEALAAPGTPAEQDLVAFENVRRMLVQYYSPEDIAYYEPPVQRLLADWEAAGYIQPLLTGASIFEQEKFAAELAALVPEGSPAQGFAVLTRTQQALGELVSKYPVQAEQLRVDLDRTLQAYEAGELTGAALLKRARQHEVAVLLAAGWSAAAPAPHPDEPAAVLRQWLQACLQEATPTAGKPAAADVAAWASQTEALLRPLVIDPATAQPRVDARQSRVSHAVRQLLEDQLWQLRTLLPALIPAKLDDLVDQLEVIARQQYGY